MTENSRPPLPPFTDESAVNKVRAAENAWITRGPEVGWKIKYRNLLTKWSASGDPSSLRCVGMTI